MAKGGGDLKRAIQDFLGTLDGGTGTIRIYPDKKQKLWVADLGIKRNTRLAAKTPAALLKELGGLLEEAEKERHMDEHIQAMFEMAEAHQKKRETQARREGLTLIQGGKKD